MDCEITYKGKDYTYDQFATLLHSGELEVLAPKMDSRYFIVNEGYNPFEDKKQGGSVGVGGDVVVLAKNNDIIKQNKIEGGLLNEQQSIELQKEIESKYNTGVQKFGQENEDIRQSMYNYDNPLAEKDVNGINLRIADGLIEGDKYSGNRRKTYLLYADGKIAGKFYSVSDAKKVVKFIEDNLVKGIGKAEVVKEPSNTEGYEGMFNPKKTGISGLDDLLEDDGYNYFYKGKSGEVVMMSPDAYLKKVRDDITRSNSDLNVLEEKKASIIEGINKGDKINMPYLSLKENGQAHQQEGRNRAVVARERGEKLIPVFIEKDISFDDKVAKGNEYIKSAIKDGATTKEEVLSKLKEQGLHRDGIRFIDDNFDDKSIEQLSKVQPLEQAKKNLKKAWNKLGNQGIVYDPLQNERDFIDFVKALFDYVKVYGRDKAIPEMTKYVKTKLGIGGKGELKPEASNAIEQYAQSLLDKYSELSQKEIDAVLTAFGDNVGKESFTKNVDTMVRFGKMKTEKANQLKDLYDQASQIKTTREEEQAKTMGDKPKFASPIQILLMDVGDNASGEVLKRITQITTNNNQERSDEDIQKDATYIEESLDRLRNIAFDDASMLYSFYNSSPDWVSKFLTELEQNRKDAKTDKAYSVGSARLVGILNVMNNDTYERILQATDPIEREELMKLRDRLDSFTNDTMRDISLGLNARRSDMVLAEFARGGVLNDYATSRILTRSQTEQVARIQEAIKNKPSQKQLNNVNIPTTNPTTPSATKSKPKASSKKKVDAKFEAEMIEESKKAKTISREDRAKELRDRLFNAINKCK